VRWRAALVRVHRWVGLAIAAFIALAALTGSVLAFRPALEAALNPELFTVPVPPDAALLDPLVLRARVEQARPDARVVYLPLHAQPGRAVTVFVQPAPGQPAAAVFNDEVFIDPHTGRILGERRWGDIGQGRRNLLTFIYRLHYALAAGEWGALAFGWIALAWTLDCFIGFVLTLPGGRMAFWRRWRPAWAVRWQASAYKVNFDVHRAGGLWTWPLLFVFAWSSVALNLPQAYELVMRGVVSHQAPAAPRDPAPTPGISWEAARAHGREHASAQAALRGFEVFSEHALAHDAGRDVFVYDVRTSLDVQEERGNTRLLIDARNGALVHLWQPSGAGAGDTLREWLVALHVAGVFGMAYKIVVALLGVFITSLCVTGVVIWWRKRRGRRFHAGVPDRWIDAR
jgi:uncharacterized iron-regulated membrane protein